VVDARAITDVDFSATCALEGLRRELGERQVTLALIVASARRQDELADSGLLDLADAARIFDSREACISAYLAEDPQRRS
jgi:MFS superfamily sulfate permease-like transporter